MKKIARNLTDCEDGFLNGTRYQLMDRDGKFSPALREIVKNEGVKPVQLPPKSPNLNCSYREIDEKHQIGVSRKDDFLRREIIT